MIVLLLIILSVCSLNAQTRYPSKKPIGLYDGLELAMVFDEQTGLPFDLSGKSSGFTFNEDPAWGFNQTGTYLIFDNDNIGSDAVMWNTPAGSPWHSAITEISCFAIVTKTAFAFGPMIIFKIGDQNDGIAFGYRNGPQVTRMEVRSTASSYITTGLVTISNSASVTYSVGFKIDSGGATEVYYNGESDNTGTCTLPNASTAEPAVGGFNGGVGTTAFGSDEDSWGGEIYCIFVWFRALSDEEMRYLHDVYFGYTAQAINSGISEKMIAAMIGKVPSVPSSTPAGDRRRIFLLGKNQEEKRIFISE